jgi:hypothetical protein
MNGLPVRIANTTLGSDTASIDFSSIPGHYAHLMLEMFLRGDTAAASTSAMLRINGDTAGSYDFQGVEGSAAAAAAAESFAQTAISCGFMPANTAGANLFGAINVHILNFATASQNKVLLARWAHKSGTATTNMNVGCRAGFWRSNTALTQVTIFPVAGNLKLGSRVTLYGLA